MSSTTDPSRPSWRRALLVGTALLVTALVVGAAVLLTGHGGSDGDGAGTGSGTGSGQPSAGSTPVPLDRLAVARAPFCSRIARSPVRAALASRLERVSGYAPGDRVELAPGLRDVADEFGCSYTAVTGARARVWVFAAPVGLARARRLAGDVGPGCRALSGTVSFGRAAAGSVCRSTQPAGRSVTLRGLFGDAWLSCRVTSDSPQLAVADRTRAWCTTVVRGLAG